MKHSIALLAILACFGAHAHGSQQPPTTTPTPTPAPVTATAAAGALGIGLGIGIGQGGAATGGSVSGSGNGTAQVLSSGNSANTYNAAPVTGGALDLAGAKFGGDTIVPKQAPSVSMTAPTQPITSCRLGISLFGSSSGGAGGGGIPAGNDATCLAGAKLEAMKRAGGFSVESMQRVACTIEGMADLPECKRLKDGERAAAILEGRQQVADSQPQQLP